MLQTQFKLSFVLFLITTLIIIFSITQCCSFQNNNKEENKIINSREFSKRPLPHGSAKVACTIMRKFEKDDKIYCVAKIDTVLSYGTGTKPIGIASTVELELREKLLSKSVKSINDLFKINSHHIIFLKVIKNGFNNDQDWKIISIEN